jgi:hypothetical protein
MRQDQSMRRRQHRRQHRRLLPPLVLAATATLAVGCAGSDDSGEAEDGTVRISEVGESFTFRDLTVAEGWDIRPIERTVGIGETTTSPEIRGEVTNEGDEPAFALFEMVFAAGSEPVSTVKCSSSEIPPGESVELLCPGLGQPVPEGYDQIVIQEITR